MTAADPAPPPGPHPAASTAQYGPAGFEEFFRHYEPMVRRYLIWQEADPGILDDAAQLTMVSAFRYWDRVGQMDPPTGWLFKVARQRLQDARESRRRNGILLGADALHDTTAHPDPITTCDQRLDILAAVSKLPRRQQEAVALREQFGLPYKEIAAIMGASPATVRAHVYQARKTLEAMLGDDMEGGDA
ncbi:sigma-70 family RNA polymerase sigma factor [Streptomyces longwoodensis]|uniref:RNA polymerase sigma factor n=1 Tax=Streptomyces longwoodensis TaxID=68231 RepID=UPI0033DD30AD